MYRVKKRMEISAAHKLSLPYPSRCAEMHGHNWVVEVTMEADGLDENGMVMDFTTIKRRVHDVLDHSLLNDMMVLQPTAENIAKWIYDQLTDKETYIKQGLQVTEVMVRESEGNTAWYTR